MQALDTNLRQRAQFAFFQGDYRHVKKLGCARFYFVLYSTIWLNIARRCWTGLSARWPIPPGVAEWAGLPDLGCWSSSTTTFSLLGWPTPWPEWQSDAPPRWQHRQEGSTGVADQATEKISIAAPPERCFTVAADLEHYPEWAADIKEVEVKERDDLGRPLLVTFRAAAFGRSTSYTLAYDYAEAPRVLAWKLTQGDITTKLDGSYIFDAGEGGGTDVTYHLEAELRVPIPGFIKMRATSRIMATAMRELKARVESDS